MRLDEFVEGFERDEAAERRRLAEEKSYEITNYLDDVERQFQETVQGDSLFGSTAPEIFVGRSGYPDVSTGVLSPMAEDADAEAYATSGDWYHQGLGVGDVLQRRTGLLNSTRSAKVDVNDVWDGFVGTQREVAIADHPVDVEVGLDDAPEIDLTLDDIGTPTGPRANAREADLAENPHVPRSVEKTLEDDDWRAEGAMTYLYRRGFDVYEVNTILSAGALGQNRERKLVPTRWSITAVDDTVGQYLRGGLLNRNTIDQTEVWYNEYMGNRYWVLLSPGQWEFELVEMKAPESVWNPEGSDYYLASASEGYEGRTGYVDETAGAYYASRLGVLEHLRERDRQAKCLVLREVTDEYWAPVGVWQVREGVRNAFDDDARTDAPTIPDGQPAVAETFRDAVNGVVGQLPVPMNTLRRKSDMVAGIQAQLSDF
ncbi:DNA repair protein NreA [Halomicrobium salinisoli]|uniref:DNA repair protein NreA n=1 Tax=Halomicrobium salinisoli TaxID=2878391 RepID=UPI001CF02C78|nr:DNA repair protein NreA [Halomicrobium salinisoli]